MTIEMTITIPRAWIEQLKTWLKRHKWNKLGVFFSSFGYVWAVWQHEILMKTTLNWSKYPILSISQTFLDWAWSQDFDFFSGVRTTWGVAYDYTLLLQGICFLFGLISIYTWND